MPFPLQRVLDPIVEPVSLVDMKNYLRVDATFDDSLIQTLTSAARERAEDLTARCLVKQQWIWSFDRFPLYGYRESLLVGLNGHNHSHRHSMFRSDELALIIPRGPVLSVDSITYKDNTGAVQTLDTSVYEVDLLSQPARIRPAYNGSWPVALFDTNSITVSFTAGYQQTVTENLLVTAAAPFTAQLSRFPTFLSLTSVTDVTSKAPVSPTSLDVPTGILTVPSAEAGLQISVVYIVSSIPQSFLHAIKLMVGAWYENRQEVVQGGGNFNSMPTPLSASSLLGTYEMFVVGYPKE